MPKCWYKILFLLCLSVKSSGQDFEIPISSKVKDEFTIQYLSVLNQAPFNFVLLKGKQVPGTDSLHKGSQIFNARIKLPGSIKSRLVKDSTLYAEYFYGDYLTREEALNQFEKLISRIQKAFSRKAYVKYYYYDSTSTLLKQAKIAYVLRSGFFHFNTDLQVIQLANSRFRILFQIYSGKPQFYHKVVYEPIPSFVLVNDLHSNLAALQDVTDMNCPTDLLAFECMGKKIQGDSVITRYVKNGMDDYDNAMSEYDVLITNIRASLGTKYVYYYLPVKAPYLLKMAFIQIDDIEKFKRKTIIVGLLQTKAANDAFPGYMKMYALDITFTY